MKSRRQQETAGNNFAQSQSGLHPLAPSTRIGLELAELTVKLEVHPDTIGSRSVKKSPRATVSGDIPTSWKPNRKIENA